MKALLYRGPRRVELANVEQPTVNEPCDAIVQISTTNICGSDLHMYEGRTDVADRTILGHENMGVVTEVGPGVVHRKAGDRVSVPFNIACGTCRNCEAGWTSYCLTTNPTEGMDGAAYGYASMGPYAGGQAEFLRVPYADFNLLALPPGTEHEADFAMLSDVFPTGYHATELAHVGPGDRVAVFGAGPVGLMATHSAYLRGGSQVYVVDKEPDRLRLATDVDALPIDLSQGDPVEQIVDATDGMGVDKGIEAVGYQAHDADGHEHPELVLDNLVRVVRSTGAIGVAGVYVPQDPGGVDESARQGRIGWDYGTFFSKGLRMGSGQAPQAVQPAAARPDRRGPLSPGLDRLARAAAGRRPGGVREVRPARGGLDQGAAPPGGMTASVTHSTPTDRAVRLAHSPSTAGRSPNRSGRTRTGGNRSPMCARHQDHQYDRVRSSMASAARQAGQRSAVAWAVTLPPPRTGSMARAGTPLRSASTNPCSRVVTTRSARESSETTPSAVLQCRQSPVSSLVSTGTGAQRCRFSQRVSVSWTVRSRRSPYSGCVGASTTAATGTRPVAARRLRSTRGRPRPSRARIRWKPAAAGPAGSTTETPTAMRRQCAYRWCSRSIAAPCTGPQTNTRWL